MSLKHAILAALSDKPQTGYDLGTEMKGSICFFWNASRQQIYKELASLEKEKWVTHKDIRQEERPDKKVYQITPSGLQELKEWIGRETDCSPVRDALLIKVFVGQLVPKDTLLKEIHGQQQKQSEKLKLLLWLEEKHLKSRNVSLPKYQFQYLTLRRGILVTKGWLAWAKEAQDYIESRIDGIHSRGSVRRITKSCDA